VVVIDCLTFWISNLLVRGDKAARIEAQIEKLVRTLERPAFHVVIVSNEVGLGIVPDNRLAREFRDLVGRAHQRIAPLCDELYLGALGVIVRLRPAPVAVLGPVSPPSPVRRARKRP
jgi:adenosylcobinamide kinase/adenosylcobinamide-phosphate guanylyltransferase